MVFYRKYRPQTISELDLASVRDKLTKMLSSESLPHAFLFTGPKGLGKTSSARILAKAINCPNKGKGVEPCNTCDICTAITNGSHIDVIEIDAASNRGIDEIRDLREKIKFAPSNLKKKVYIIDEVHMLTTEAFNALLKTLEEPPEHVVFILATTEFWKLPGTIVSRAFHVQFEKPGNEELIRSLSRIVTGEKLDVEEGVLDIVCSLADGAFRDAAKILEEISLLSEGKKITKALLEQSYKTDSIEQEVVALLKALSQKNTKEAFQVIERLSGGGCDFKVVTEQAVEKLHTLLLIQAGFERKSTLDLSFQAEELERLLEYFNDAYKNIKFSVIPALPLELLAVKYCQLDQVVKAPTIIQEIKKEEASPVIKNQQGASKIIESTPQEDEFLKSLIEKVKKDNFSIAGVLRSTRIGKIDDTLVELVTPFKFHGEKLQHDTVRVLLEAHASEILGKSIKMVITIKAN